MPKVLMLLSNAFRPDPRVAREAVALARQGYQVCVLAWDRRVELPERQDYQGVEIARVQNVRTGYGSGPRQLFYTPRFWRQAVRYAKGYQPDIVHCNDLDTLYAGAQIKKKLGCKLVYDAHENYPALMSLYLPGVMVKALAMLERSLLGQADAVITASSTLAEEFQKKCVRSVAAIGNYQDLEPFYAVSQAKTASLRADLNISPDELIVAYIGGFTRNREILPLIQAVQGMAGVQTLLWGDGHQRKAVQAAVSGSTNTRYLGWLPADQVPAYACMADVIYYCLRSDYPGAVYNASNTLSNAMAAGRPVISNPVGDLGATVEQTACGLLIDPVTPANITAAIQRLMDPALRQRLGENGRKAAESTYNARAAGQKLVDLYKNLS